MLTLQNALIKILFVVEFKGQESEFCRHVQLRSWLFVSLR